MKGDFSRMTFNKEKGFSRVLMQQGRVQVDADWNEQVAILLYYLRYLAADLIGSHGGPAADLGFEITPGGDGIKIGEGRYYVDGILCKNAQETAVAVPDIKDPQDPDGLLLYLDVWERHITYLEDEDEHGDEPSIREVALGGADTASRAKVVWRVRALPVAALSPATKVEKLLEELESATLPLADAMISRANGIIVQLKELRPTIAAIIDSLADDVPDEVVEALNAIDGSLQALTRLSSGTEEEVNGLKSSLNDLSSQLPSVWDLLIESVGSLLRLHLAPSRATLRARARQDPDEPDDPCAIPPESRYRGLENQLYRVEVHRGGEAGEATFKWSRENGSVVFPIVEIADTIVTLEHLGKDDRLGLRVGDWVEAVDDEYILSGGCAPLLQVERIDPDVNQVVLSGKPTIEVKQGPFNHPLLRRWDHKQGDPTKNGLELDGEGAAIIKEGEADTNDNWLHLEAGVQVQFVRTGKVANHYRTGDYWLIPARTTTGDVEWPGPWRDPAAVAPDGVEHHYAPLARISVDGNDVEVKADCRRSFAPEALPV